MTIAHRTIAALLLAALAVPAQAQDDATGFAMFGDPRVDAPVTSFQLREVVTAPADIARFTVEVASDDSDSPEAALRANSAKANAVVAALKAQGLTEGDFKPGRVIVSERRGGRSSSVRGYTASNRISVETADVARVSLMLAAAVAAGATASDGPNFDRKDMNPMLVPARERLFRQAEAQAKDYARAAGYARVRPIAISERVGNDYESYGSLGIMESAAAVTEADLAEIAPPTPSTDVSRSLQVSISFRLER